MKSNQAGRLAFRALVVSDELASHNSAARALGALISDLRERGVEVMESPSASDAHSIISADPSIQCILLDWDLHRDTNHEKANALVDFIRRRNAQLPLFLIAERSTIADLPLEIVRSTNDFIWLLEDMPDFFGGRVLASIARYRQQILPPMFRALVEFAGTYEYSWHTPGHTGGTAFLKSPVGRAFFSFFGEELFRSDLSISVGELGSLLDHSGPIGAGERYAAEVFGAHRTYTVTNGSSTSNRVILMASAARNQIVLCDRNCHKSVEHAITLSGAIPVYFMPTRNHLGIIGPISSSQLTPAAITAAIAANPLADAATDLRPVHAIITNSTYDGLCYDIDRVEGLLGQSVDRLHFDEAWYAYARFNPLYEKRLAMRGDSSAYGVDRPTVFAVQSTHKLLAALSQASFIHVRDGRQPIEHGRFNETFMMHASTSPQYAIIASNDVSAAMMDGGGGKVLTDEAIREAVAFRRLIASVQEKYRNAGDWFFGCWQPDNLRDPSTSEKKPFADVAEDVLATDPGCWILRPGEAWHGFGELEDGYCMLDPIKVSIVTPGLGPDGQVLDHGIPATLLTAYLDNIGIQVEKTTDFTVLFLFSIGVTKGKWGTLVDALLGFKRDYDANTPLSRVIPKLLTQGSRRYVKMGLQDLAKEMFGAMQELRTTEWQAVAFTALPKPDLSPSAAYERLVRGQVRRVGLSELEGQTVATGIVPYPPGIPLLMPGENAGSREGAAIAYLSALEAFDGRFPGFEHDIHGVEVEGGAYTCLCIAQSDAKAPIS